MQISDSQIATILSILKSTAHEYPRAFANCHADHNQHPERLDFIILAAKKLWDHSVLKGTKGERAGLNGKRGNGKDPSADVVAYGIGNDVVIADILERAGAHEGRVEFIKWMPIHIGPNDPPGLLVDPTEWKTKYPYAGGQPVTPTQPVEPPKPARIPWDRGEMLVMLKMLNQMYKNELKRPEGLWIHGEPDFEGIAAWGLDVYQQARLAGRSAEEAMDEMLVNIRRSDEWREKNR